jgi:hypothetical protein
MIGWGGSDDWGLGGESDLWCSLCQTSFLLDERGGNDNSGYVSVGYFGGKSRLGGADSGITLGRVLLIPVTKWLGNHNSIYI